MADPRFWISLSLSAFIHAVGIGWVCAVWVLLHLGASRLETAPILLVPYGDSDAEGMKVETVALDPGALKEGTENTPGGSMDEEEPYRPVVSTPVVRPQESEEEPEPVVVTAPEPTPPTPTKVETAKTEPKSTPTAPKRETVRTETGPGEKSAGAPGGASLKSGTPSAGGRLGVTTGVDSSRIGKPPYPPLALAYRQQGVVKVEVRISAEGKVLEARLVHPGSVHTILENAALEFCRNHARFGAATRDGVPIESTVIWPVEYELTNR
jgi:TonB family protein